MTVVGVVGSVKQYALDTDSRVALYSPHDQISSGNMYVVVRTRTDPRSRAPSVTAEVRALEPNVVVYDVKTMEQWLSESLARRRFAMFSIGLFAGVAMLLASVGIYGVTSYSVAQRTHEIGIRMALGAERGNVVGLVMRQGMRLAGVGVLIGLIGAPLLTRVMASLLFGVAATGLLTFGSIALLLAIVAVLACYFPALRATKVDPLIALRHE